MNSDEWQDYKPLDSEYTFDENGCCTTSWEILFPNSKRSISPFDSREYDPIAEEVLNEFMDELDRQIVYEDMFDKLYNKSDNIEFIDWYRMITRDEKLDQILK